MRHTWIGVATLLALSVARPTPAATAAGSRSWTNGDMMGDGTGAFYGTVGFPGLSLGYMRGMSDTLDAGGRFSFNYGGEGSTAAPSLGLKLAGDVKLKAGLSLPFGTLTVRVLPGIGLYFPQGFNIFFLQFPVEAALGFQVMPNLLGHVSVQVPVGFAFWSGLGVSFTSMQIPILAGGGVELKIDEALSVTGQLHMGPYVGIFFGGLNGTSFALDAVIGVTYRLPS
jgi:hypothetical protein